MTQKHYQQHGLFHITINAQGRIPWCTLNGIPEILIDNLMMTRNLYEAKVYAFCVLPDHMHIILNPGAKGLSKFVHSFKKNSMRDICTFLGKYNESSRGDFRISAAADNDQNCRNSDSNTLPSRRNSDSKIAVFNINDIRWQKGFYDERIRCPKQRSNALAYVQNNAYKHKLVDTSKEWQWSSMHFKHVIDQTDLMFDSPFDPN